MEVGQRQIEMRGGRIILHTRANRKAHRVAKVPAQKTLVMEQGILRQVFRHAIAQGWLENIPYMQTKSAKTNRRSAFTVGEYLTMIRVMRRRIKTATCSRVLHDRRLLELYIRLMAGTGMRIGEARRLVWTDVEIITTGGNEVLRLWVDGKTGKRALIGTTAAKLAMRKLFKFYGFVSLQEAREAGGYLFTKTNGDLVKTFEVGFKNLLVDAGLLKDRHGKNRPLYCLRHFYASTRLLFGDVNVYLLAKNMGTSVLQVEQHYGHVSTTQAAHKLL